MRPPILSSRRMDAAESAANSVVGTAINWTLLALVFGQPLTATWITAAMIGVSSARQYLIRRAFRALENHHG